MIGLNTVFELNLSWSPDWRLLFSAGSGLATFEWPPKGRFSIWAIPVEPRTAQSGGRPERLTQWSDFMSVDLTVAADGRRLSYVKEYFWDDLYLGELDPGGAGMKPPRRFTFDGRWSSPSAWTPDGQAILFSSNRNDRSEVFRQGLRDSVAEAVVQGPDDYHFAELSPDGFWLLYTETARTARGAPAAPWRVMRRPVAGGSPELVLESPADAPVGCACPTKPGAGCVLAQLEGKDVVYYRLDLLRGKGERLGAIEAGPGYLSPDGATIAAIRATDPRPTIHLLTVSDHQWHEIVTEPGWIMAV